MTLPEPEPEGSRGERDAPRMSEPKPTGQHQIYLIFDDWDWGYSIRKLKLPLRSPHQPSLRPLEQRRRPEHKRLPPPCICLEAVRRCPFFFAAVGTNIIAAHPRNPSMNSSVIECFIPIFDGRSQGLRFGPGLFHAVKPVMIPVGDDKLFALDVYSFRMLSMKRLCTPDQWSWCDLPQPPLEGIDVTSFAVGSDGLTIFASTDCATFAFDVPSGEWKQSSNCGELDQLTKNVDEGDGASGSMQECGELDELKKFVVEGDASRSMHDRYLYRLTTFSLSFDNNGDLTTGETCVVQCYKVPKKVSEAIYLFNPVAFCV